MKAMILAAGYGERMLPLTLGMPKPAIPVLGRPLITQKLRRLKLHGVEEAVINLHHLPDYLPGLLGDGNSGGLPAVRYSYETTILGTGGGIARAAPLLRGGGTLLVSNSDFLADVDVRTLIERHREGGWDATLVLAAPRNGYSRVERDLDGRIVSIAGDPAPAGATETSSHLFTGTYLLEEPLLDRLPPDRPGNVLDLLRALAAERRLGSFVHEGFWWEFGSPQQYLEGHSRLLHADPAVLREFTDADPVHDIGRARVSVGAGADIDLGGRFAGACAVGFAASVGGDVALEDSVVLPESWVGPGSIIRRSIVGPAVELPAGFEIESAIVCPDWLGGDPPPPGVERRDGLLVRRFAGVAP